MNLRPSRYKGAAPPLSYTGESKLGPGIGAALAVPVVLPDKESNLNPALQRGVSCRLDDRGPLVVGDAATRSARAAVARRSRPVRLPAPPGRYAVQRWEAADHVGDVGLIRNCIPASVGVRSPLRWLQPPQAATVFTQVLRPPRERGRMWSMVLASWPQ